MDDFFMEHVKQTTPKMNPDIVNGLAVKMIGHTLEYLTNVVQSVANDFVDGLRFKDPPFEICNPEEELRRVNIKKNEKYVIETANSSLYLVKMMLEYKDPTAIDVRTSKPLNKYEDLDPCYIFLPYVGEAGMISISGVKYFISPILADVVLSFEKDCIFLNLLRAKFGIKFEVHSLIRDGIYEDHKVLWSRIYNENDKEIDKNDKVSTKPKSTLAHYLFCYKGFYETFKEYGHCTPVLGTTDINTDNYPKADWHIYESSRRKLKGSRYSLHTPIKVAIRKSEINESVESFIAAFFYLLDHFPNFFSDITWVNSKVKWRLMLGEIIKGIAKTAGDLIETADDHIESIEQYLDTIVKYKLKTIGIHTETLFEFFAYAIANYNEWSIKSKENLNSIYDKELSILHYTLGSIVKSINTFYFKLKSASKSNTGRILSKKDINNILRSNIKSRKIFKIKESQNGLTTIAYPGDNKFMKITCSMIPQKSLSKNKNDDIDIKDLANRLHPSFMANGSHLNLPKNNPIGYRTVNPYALLDSDNKFVVDPQEKVYLDRIHEIIRRK